ncbi:MAG: ribbon-helix-helix protein, CopG family [Thermoplasmatota archaeon]
MLIEPAMPREDGVREVRVKLPADVHVRLHAIKLLSGRSMSDVVEQALRDYIARAGPAAARRPTVHVQP